MQRSHKIELSPNNKQMTYFVNACGVSRFAWNWAVADWQAAFSKKEKWNHFDSKKRFNAIKKKEFPWTGDVTKYAAQQPFIDIKKSIDMFYAGHYKKRMKKNGPKRRKNGTLKGTPNFKKKGKSIDSFYIGGDQIKISDFKIHIPKLGWIKTKESLRYDGKINSATISRKANRWYVAIQVKIDKERIERKDFIPVGVDLGIKSIITTSDGHFIESINPLRISSRKLARLNRKLQKKKSGSNNRKKHQIKIAKYHSKVANQRKDIIHKITSFLSKNYSHIAIEDLNVSGMLKNHKLSRAISDIGFYEIRRQLEYKIDEYGGYLYPINRWFPSSKLCPVCGQIKDDLKLSDRTFKCDCGHVSDRDYNAAINLRSQIPGVPREYTPVEITAMQKSVHPFSVTSIKESGIEHHLLYKDG